LFFCHHPQKVTIQDNATANFKCFSFALYNFLVLQLIHSSHNH